MDLKSLASRVKELIADGVSVPMRAPGQQYSGRPGRLEPGMYAEWRARTIATLAANLPSGHPYRTQFEELSLPTDHGKNDPSDAERDSGVGVLSALGADLEGGHLVGLVDLISAELFSDFVGMAQHLHEQGYHHAAASVAGAVLEDSLRRKLLALGQRATGNLESMNQLALDTQLYTPLTYQQVKVWIGIRNHADHGEWDKVDEVQVQTMILGVANFLSQSLGLP